jgi:Spy/CpxP family protein refolding chaperone
MKARLFCSIALALVITAPTLLAQQGPTGPRARQGERLMMMEQLKLSDEQRKETEQLRFDMAKRAVERQAKVKTARLELAELFKADSPDKAAIEKKVNEIAQLQSQGRMSFINHWFAVNKLLNADQQKTWKGMLGRAWMQRDFGRMRGMAPRRGMGERWERFREDCPMMNPPR